MAYPSEHYGLSSTSNGSALRVILMLAAAFLVLYMMRPLHSSESSSVQVSCPCDCDCPEDFSLPLQLEFINISYPDCGKHDPHVSEEMGKNRVAMLSEELDLHKIVANDSLSHTMVLVNDATKNALQYQGEVERCFLRMGTCEEAREKAEAELIEERKITSMWERRAHEFGWKDDRKVYI